MLPVKTVFNKRERQSRGWVAEERERGVDRPLWVNHRPKQTHALCTLTRQIYFRHILDKYLYAINCINKSQWGGEAIPQHVNNWFQQQIIIFLSMAELDMTSIHAVRVHFGHSSYKERHWEDMAPLYSASLIGRRRVSGGRRTDCHVLCLMLCSVSSWREDYGPCAGSTAPFDRSVTEDTRDSGLLIVSLRPGCIQVALVQRRVHGSEMAIAQQRTDTRNIYNQSG